MTQPHLAFKCKHWWKAKVTTDLRKNFLTEDQAIHIYKKVELSNIINTSTLKQEIDQD